MRLDHLGGQKRENALSFLPLAGHGFFSPRRDPVSSRFASLDTGSRRGTLAHALSKKVVLSFPDELFRLDIEGLFYHIRDHAIRG